MLHSEGAGAGHEEEGNQAVFISLWLTDVVCFLFCSNQLLVQAAEWKLQAQQLREQGTVMQAQVNINLQS